MKAKTNANNQSQPYITLDKPTFKLQRTSKCLSMLPHIESYEVWSNEVSIGFPYCFPYSKMKFNTIYNKRK